MTKSLTVIGRLRPHLNVKITSKRVTLTFSTLNRAHFGFELTETAIPHQGARDPAVGAARVVFVQDFGHGFRVYTHVAWTL